MCPHHQILRTWSEQIIVPACHSAARGQETKHQPTSLCQMKRISAKRALDVFFSDLWLSSLASIPYSLNKLSCPVAGTLSQYNRTQLPIFQGLFQNNKAQLPIFRDFSQNNIAQMPICRVSLSNRLSSAFAATFSSWCVTTIRTLGATLGGQPDAAMETSTSGIENCVTSTGNNIYLTATMGMNRESGSCKHCTYLLWQVIRHSGLLRYMIMLELSENTWKLCITLTWKEDVKANAGLWLTCPNIIQYVENTAQAERRYKSALPTLVYPRKPYIYPTGSQECGWQSFQP